ncbi:hypothetical protein PSI23_20800 [Xenorhabdus sp. XENO-10]|uniref:RHS family protein n=1 Tax=Xenorhabdus yunnanensis TaxID=3025878 RepID=A0ABT5LKK9_9GAMM|nr:RHS repeat-associated core domain-containing protein [Xenorhabdus yunnanensis]MDC9591651.1 hypothetical protein [Xenorhabdus yunnanensis]
MTAMQLWEDGHRPQLTKFRWNSQNQLIGVQTPGGQQWAYRYDAFGRRTEKVCERAGMRTTYLWDGDVPAEIREYRHNRLYSIRHLVFDGWQLLAQQVQFFTLNPENRHELIAGNIQTQYAVCAPTGEPLALFDEAGHRVWRQPPQSLYGLRLGVPGENAELNPGIQFAGQWLDEESGLVYNRFRYYSPVAGQYLTPDPLGLLGGENSYAYVKNPTGWVDPHGLAGCSAYLRGWGRGKKGFENFWDNSTKEQFMKAWDNPKFRDNIKDRLRKNGGSKDGGFHEWLPVSRADKFKEMGVTFNEYMKWRTPTGKVKFLDDNGVMGTHTLPHSGGVSSQSSLAHRELIAMADNAKDINGYLSAVRKWSSKRLPFGPLDLPF